MKRKNDKDMTDDNKFVPRKKPVINARFAPYEQDISPAATANAPFVPLTVEDALARQKKKDK